MKNLFTTKPTMCILYILERVGKPQPTGCTWPLKLLNAALQLIDILVGGLQTLQLVEGGSDGEG